MKLRSQSWAVTFHFLEKNLKLFWELLVAISKQKDEKQSILSLNLQHLQEYYEDLATRGPRLAGP